MKSDVFENYFNCPFTVICSLYCSYRYLSITNKEKQITDSLLNEGDGDEVTKEDEIDSYRRQVGHAINSHRNDTEASVFRIKITSH